MNTLESLPSQQPRHPTEAEASFLRRETPDLSNSVQGVRKKIRRLTGRAIQDFSMIQDGDLIMVCMSGGADSYTMLDTLLYLKHVAPIKFDVIAVNLDQKQPGFPEDVLPRYFTERNIPFRIVEQDTYSIVKAKVAPGKTTCSLCSRLRRGILYRTAKELGATKIALGHHRDDILETLLLNMFFGGRIKTMPPKLKSDDGSNIVIRPLAYCKEADIKKYAAAMQFPIIPCNLCGSQPNLQRQAMKELLQQWDQAHPQRLRSMFSAISNVVPSHMMDHKLFDFENFQGIAYDKTYGDILFDRDETLDQFQNTIALD
ncbi:MAG: tRNA 2-thiocytidine(32) synthetase TtcA [Burkholderiaceae bacterium]|nr:tRNA 2-thiocytidine(32) synthetase TtcA [Burkholderiaceae bacterium]